MDVCALSMHVDDADILRELIDAADETATSNPGASYARWSDDREIGQWAILPGAALHRDSETLQRSNAEVIRADMVTATAHGAWVLEEGGERRFEPGGWTDVHWYSQREEDPAMPCYCPSCDWQGAPADMKAPPTS